MNSLRCWFLIFVCCAPCGSTFADDATPEAFPSGIILLGAVTKNEPEADQIKVISETGELRKNIYRSETRGIISGRLSRQRDRLAFSKSAGEGKSEIWVVDDRRRARKVLDDASDSCVVTAWSPDGKTIGFYHAVPGPKPNESMFESCVVEVESGKVTKLELPSEYVAEDWHPRENVRTAMFMNSRNLLYREMKGDHYPTRQLDLLVTNGGRTPVTKNPSSDNIWSRFSPTGDRIAHYHRRLDGEKSLEFAVVCQTDGSKPREVFAFTAYGDKRDLPWFRPNNSPAWSPDGETLAWLVSANTKSGDQDRDLRLVLVRITDGSAREVSLSKLGYEWVSSLDWR